MSDMDDMDDILTEFLVESYEGLDQMERDLVSLEQTPTDEQLLGAIFRSIHTIKGTCGFFSLARLEAVAHAAETALDSFRDNPNPKIVEHLRGLENDLDLDLAAKQIAGGTDVLESPAEDVACDFRKGQGASRRTGGPTH